MNWKYNNSIREHQLVYKNSPLARIIMSPRKRGGYKVTSLVSVIYYGGKIQKHMERCNREWLAYRKKFKDKESAELYLSRKKADILRFITSREKEG